jgi:citrate synthase
VANRYPTALGTSNAQHISLMGMDVADDLMGKVGFGELAFWLVAQRRPTAGEVRLFEAILVSLTDHGFTPTAMSARLTYYSAPDSIQGAVAAGVLGAGSRFLGVTEDAGLFLHAQVADLGPEVDGWSAEQWDVFALELISAEKAAKRFVPGLGHRTHKDEDPRVPVILRLAREEGVYGRHLKLLESIGRVNGQVLRTPLPINGAGITGAALADLGLPVEMLRGFSILARTAGVIGHIAEEQRRPIGQMIYAEVEGNAEYIPLDPR